MKMSNEQRRKIEERGKKARVAATAHQAESGRFHKWHLVFGYPATILSAIVGTSVFAAVQELQEPAVRYIVGAMSVLAAVLAGVQTWRQFSSKSGKHDAAAGGYRELEEALDRLPAFFDGTDNDLTRKIAELDGQRAILDKSFPRVSDPVWEAAKEVVAQDLRE